MAGDKKRIAAVGPLRGAVRWTLLSLLVFFLIEGLLFRSGWYTQYLAPQSIAGQVELMHVWLNNSRPTATPEVLVLGDSRIAEGFSARVAGAEVMGRIHFWNAGTGGTSPRVWFYQLRDVDPGRNRFAAIVLPFDHYSDQEDPESYDKRVSDLTYAIGRLRAADCFAFARSMNTPKAFLHVFAGCLFKGMILREDLNDLMSDPSARLKAARLWRTDGRGFLDGYEGKSENVSGISADWVHRRINFPPGLTQIQRATIEGTVMPRIVPQDGALARYRRLWFGKILGLYANSATRFIFMEVPRGPLPQPESPVPAAFIQSMTAGKAVSVLPANTFRDLENPELFADGLHLNRMGRPLFSKRLAMLVSGVAGGH